MLAQSNPSASVMDNRLIALLVFIITNLEQSPTRSNRLRLVCDGSKIFYDYEVDPEEIYYMLSGANIE